MYDSNGSGLQAMMETLGAEVVRYGPVPDEADALRAQLVAAAREHEIVLVTGGTSAGARDLLPELVRSHGDVLFHGVRIRPGKPVLAGRWGNAFVFGLPGYPTSCLLAADLFVAPVVARVAGSTYRPAMTTARLDAPLASKKGWHQFIPVHIDDDGVARSVFRGSGAVSSLSRANGLVAVDEDTELIEAGRHVQVRLGLLRS